MSFLRPRTAGEWFTLTGGPLLTVVIVLLLHRDRQRPWDLSVITLSGGVSQVKVVLVLLALAALFHGCAYLVIRALRPFLTA